MGRFDTIYARLPVVGQHAAFSAYGAYWKWLRFGAGYDRYVCEFANRDRYTADQWQAWQQAKLVQVLDIAARHVPHYRDTWSAAEKRAAAEGRLAELPLLAKEPVRAEPWSFVRQDMRVRRPHVFHTSGSTGTPIASIWTTAEIRRSMAVREVRSAGWAGVSYRQPRATFSGRIIEPDPNSKGPFYRFNAAEGQVYYSTYHLRRDTAAQYVRALKRHRIEWLTGYAMSCYLLASFMIEESLSAPLKAVIPTSEKLTDAMRDTMRQAFGCRVFEEYSTVENTQFASECPQGRLHVSPDVGIVEIVRPDGSPCEPEEPGQVVTTCTMRDFQPMVRFRLGDVAAWDPRPCTCGRAMPVLREIVGRSDDVLVAPGGRQLARFNTVFANLPRVREAQVVQEAIDRLRVKVVPGAGYGPADAQEIVDRIHQRLWPDMIVVIDEVESIPRTAAGKFKAVVSLLNAGTSDAAAASAATGQTQ